MARSMDNISEREPAPDPGDAAFAALSYDRSNVRPR